MISSASMRRVERGHCVRIADLSARRSSFPRIPFRATVRDGDKTSRLALMMMSVLVAWPGGIGSAQKQTMVDYGSYLRCLALALSRSDARSTMVPAIQTRFILRFAEISTEGSHSPARDRREGRARCDRGQAFAKCVPALTLRSSMPATGTVHSGPTIPALRAGSRRTTRRGFPHRCRPESELLHLRA